jgi:hypothetical protein
VKARAAIALVLPLALAVPVFAEPPPASAPSLVLVREPMPRTLRMRRKLAQAPAPAKRPGPPMPAPPRASGTSIEPIDGLDGRDGRDRLEGLRDVRAPVSFSITTGYQVDGTRPTGEPGLGRGRAPVANQDHASLRSYGFGEAFLSTRGVGLASLETYFAVRFQAARAITTDSSAPLPDVPVPSPIATWFERSGYEFRTGWAEVRDFLPHWMRLRRLRVRAGNQFIYGPWVLHLDGVHVAYEGPLLTTSLYTGVRHSDYTRDQSDRRPLVAGGSVRFDMRGLTRALPIAIGGEYMTLSQSDETGEGAVEATLLQVDWRPRRDIVVIGQMRGVNGELANQRVELRTRYGQVTNFVFVVTRRLDADWRWDPSLVSAQTRIVDGIDTEARRYLDLGPVLPQVVVSARAGTLIRENIDLLARIALASDGLEVEQVNTFSSPYFEVAGALEVRLRRTVAVGLSVLSRQQTTRESPPEDERIVDRPGVLNPDPLPAQTLIGEEGFVELGTTLKMTLGARRFSAMVEAYGRNTRYTMNYLDMPETEFHLGGRFTVDAWVGRRIRLFASYDVSSALDAAPEISGYKSLRMMLTGIY